MNKPLTAEELQEIAENMNDLDEFETEDPFAVSDDSRDPTYVESSDDNSASENENDDPINSEDDSSETDGNDENSKGEDDPIVDNNPPLTFDWVRNTNAFIPRKTLSEPETPIILCNITRSSSEMDVFYKLWPKSLFMYIAQCTNQRLEILEKKFKKKIARTSAAEIKIVLGCTLVMCYNHLPAYHMYWSNRKSLGNEEIKSAISRDRCQLILSKLYFVNPEKPEDASKIYYIEEILSCLKKTFPSARSDSTYQSIDETMTKFKGRSSMKQYIPQKPIKRGIKLWTRCDATTGYVYDTNIYSGKEISFVEGTLGERVVLKLVESVRNPDAVFCFDRFFTSANLLHKLPYAAVGTCMKNRKNIPKFERKLQRGESEAMVYKEGFICIRWQDTKDFLVLSNCHADNIGTISRKKHDGSTQQLDCPESIIFYNNYMGGVDHADQMISQYDLDRKSAKWWRKVFYKLLMTTIYNAYIIYNETKHKKEPFIHFLTNIAENMIAAGKAEMGKKKVMKRGRPSTRTRFMENVGDNLPVEGSSRRRCVRCALSKQEKRTKLSCDMCKVALCTGCFAKYHS